MMTCMKQLNINVTAEFERDLKAYMKSRGISTKSAALRSAVHEAATRGAGKTGFDFRQWLGAGLKAPLARKRRYLTEDDLWS